MGRAASLKRLSNVLLRTIRQMEESSDVDAHDSAFISLKCSMLSRAIDLRTRAVELEAGIHIVEDPLAPESPPAAPKAETAIA